MTFLSGRPLRDSASDAAVFADRDEEIERVQRALVDGLNCLVAGERGCGLTSLLHRLSYDLRKHGVAATFVDAASAADAADLIGLVAARMLPGGPHAAAATNSVAGVHRAVALLHELSEGGATLPSVVILDSAAPAAAHGLFGRLRDEAWQVPTTWVVSCHERDRAAFLRPPADAFFDTVVTLPPLDDESAHDLLRRRATPLELPDGALEVAVQLAHGNPRALIASARALVAVGSATRVQAALAHRREVLDALGPPARVLFAELEASGPASASDANLLNRLGWTRARAAQVFADLERAGLVRATSSPSGPGRPRKVFTPIPLEEA